MQDYPTNPLTQLWRAFKSSPPPQVAQEAFDFDSRHLRRLARLQPDDRADSKDLFEYSQDLLYTEIDRPLLEHLLPFCLQAWREHLHGSNEFGGFVEHLYPVVANKHLFDLHLRSHQTEAVSLFMRSSIIEEIDDQRGPSYEGSNAKPYRWIAALTTYGVLLPDAERLWTAWCSLNTIGKAVAAVQYISCLMYQKHENPVFSSWTPDRGGGPLNLWEFAGHLCEHCWWEPNVQFLERFLNLRDVTNILSRAVGRLKGEPEHVTAESILSDLPLCDEIVASRCEELPRFLETVRGPTTTLEWTK